MAIDLTQVEADALMAMPKRADINEVFLFPHLGGKALIELQSLDNTEDFLLDIGRSRIDLARITYQNRAREVVVLRRLDIAGPPHRNPDGEVIPCPHIHVYREGYADKWAYPVLAERFSDTTNLQQTLLDFCAECNVVELPQIQTGLF